MIEEHLIALNLVSVPTVLVRLVISYFVVDSPLIRSECCREKQPANKRTIEFIPLAHRYVANSQSS